VVVNKFFKSKPKVCSKKKKPGLSKQKKLRGGCVLPNFFHSRKRVKKRLEFDDKTKKPTFFYPKNHRFCGSMGGRVKMGGEGGISGGRQKAVHVSTTLGLKHGFFGSNKPLDFQGPISQPKPAFSFSCVSLLYVFPRGFIHPTSGVESPGVRKPLTGVPLGNLAPKKAANPLLSPHPNTLLFPNVNSNCSAG